VTQGPFIALWLPHNACVLGTGHVGLNSCLDRW